MGSDSIAFDSILNLCQNRSRRIVLRTLTGEQQSLTLDDLTETIIKYNHQISLTEPSENVLTEVRLSLYHVHLPKLASEGLIDYDPELQLVELIEQSEQEQQILSTILNADSSLETPTAL